MSSPVSRFDVGWAYPSSYGNSNLHFFRLGRSLCGKWTEAETRPDVRRYAAKIERLRNLGWVCDRCYSRRRAVAA